MNKIMATTALALVVIGTAQAGPLSQADISGDAKWLFHFDWEQYNGTDMHMLMCKSPARAKAAAGIAAATAMLGFNPLEDIDSITAYGNNFVHGNGAVIIKGALNPQMATAMVEKNKSHAVESHDGYKIHTWNANGGGARKEGAVAFYNNSTAVLGRNAATVRAAIDVLTGKSASLKANPQGIRVPEVSPDTFMVAYAESFDGKVGRNPRAQLFKHVSSLTLAAAETDGLMGIEAEMAAENADKAVMINNAIAGMLSFGMLGSADNPAMGEMLNAVKMTRDGQVVNLSFSMNSSALLETVKTQMEKRRQSRNANRNENPAAAQ